METTGKYILKGKTPIECNNLFKWARYIEKGTRIVKQTQINKDVRVSTVFLGLDTSLHTGGKGKPILFETMIFGGENDGYQVRYSTWDEAVKGHKKACDMCKK